MTLPDNDRQNDRENAPDQWLWRHLADRAQELSGLEADAPIEDDSWIEGLSAEESADAAEALDAPEVAARAAGAGFQRGGEPVTLRPLSQRSIAAMVASTSREGRASGPAGTPRRSEGGSVVKGRFGRLKYAAATLLLVAAGVRVFEGVDETPLPSDSDNLDFHVARMQDDSKDATFRIEEMNQVFKRIRDFLVVIDSFTAVRPDLADEVELSKELLREIARGERVHVGPPHVLGSRLTELSHRVFDQEFAPADGEALLLEMTDLAAAALTRIRLVSFVDVPLVDPKDGALESLENERNRMFEQVARWR